MNADFIEKYDGDGNPIKRIQGIENPEPKLELSERRRSRIRVALNDVRAVFIAHIHKKKQIKEQ